MVIQCSWLYLLQTALAKRINYQQTSLLSFTQKGIVQIDSKDLVRWFLSGTFLKAQQLPFPS
ncbi:MAG: hypothetical protein JWP81_1908 [Ferruginibacter sp.]|nr:hypothetical protein [Ferruginibacter sp.]